MVTVRTYLYSKGRFHGSFIAFPVSAYFPLQRTQMLKPKAILASLWNATQGLIVYLVYRCKERLLFLPTPVNPAQSPCEWLLLSYYIKGAVLEVQGVQVPKSIGQRRNSSSCKACGIIAGSTGRGTTSCIYYTPRLTSMDLK